ncbi:hypothetical protein HELRODRAFT_179387 [Helobdella robusta]|uniref:Uncharacterized protein n=1 Tax=Helobdella robusta TaxID=6412 RepID=T1FEN0_HELRO|nr:hypothetical protein HELRODRAFT_179387 [Helobdella robusta]ESN95324.1 hypothetical protein HELRODRAFT_179387 [Helobdella robusta]
MLEGCKGGRSALKCRRRNIAAIASEPGEHLQTGEPTLLRQVPNGGVHLCAFVAHSSTSALHVVISYQSQHLSELMYACDFMWIIKIFLRAINILSCFKNLESESEWNILKGEQKSEWDIFHPTLVGTLLQNNVFTTANLRSLEVEQELI